MKQTRILFKKVAGVAWKGRAQVWRRFFLQLWILPIPFSNYGLAVVKKDVDITGEKR